MTRTSLTRFATLFLVACGVLHTQTHAGTVTGLNGFGATIPTNPFDPDGDGVTTGSEPSTTSFGPILFGFNYQETLPISNIVRRMDTEESNIGGSRIQGQGIDVFLEVAAPQPFDVGTLITTHYVRDGYAANQQFSVFFDGQFVQSGSGASPSHQIRLTTLEQPLVGVQTLRVEQPMVTFGGTFGTSYADFGEALPLAASLLPIAIADISASSPASGPTIGSVDGIADFDGGLFDTDTVTGTGLWRVNEPDTDRFFELAFERSEPLSHLVLSAWFSLPISGTIFNDQDVAVASFSAGAGELLPIAFTQPIWTSSVRVVFDGDGAIGIREAIPLKLIPEPASLTLLAAGVLLLHRRRVRQTQA